MYTIWFQLPASSVALKVNVPAEENVHLAREIWDGLKRGGFHMTSARP